MLKISVMNRTFEILPSTINLDEFHAMLEELNVYNPYIGPITTVYVHHVPSFGLPFYIGAARHFRERAGKIFRMIPSGGKGTSLPQVFFSTLGEAIERVISIHLAENLRKEGKIFYAKAKELLNKGEKILGPDNLYLFSKEQYATTGFPFQPFTDDAYLGWIEGKNIITGETIYAPAQLIVFGYRPIPKESLICYQGSAGLSLHIDDKHAIYHGTCEFIERDAINVRWVCKLPPKRVNINLAELCDFLQTKYRHVSFLHNPCIHWEIYDFSVDIPEVFVIVIHCLNKCYKSLKYMPGVGAAISFPEAFDKALREVAQTERLFAILPYFLRTLGDLPIEMRIAPDAKYEEVNNLFKTLVYYGFDENLEKVEHFYSCASKETQISLSGYKAIQSIDEKYNALLRAIKTKNLSWLAFNLTPPQFRKLKLYKIFIPELTSYFLVFPFLGHPRYYTVGLQIGEINRKLELADLNKDPVPFP
ncbi:MAG: YcaO-like family protein [Candidatus Bathyarchaeia archaeon]